MKFIYCTPRKIDMDTRNDGSFYINMAIFGVSMLNFWVVKSFPQLPLAQTQRNPFQDQSLPPIFASHWADAAQGWESVIPCQSFTARGGETKKTQHKILIIRMHPWFSEILFFGAKA